MERIFILISAAKLGESSSFHLPPPHPIPQTYNLMQMQNEHVGQI